MKKKFLLTTFLLMSGMLVAGSHPITAEPFAPTKVLFNQKEGVTYPEIGATDPNSPLGSRWNQGSYGFQRLDDYRNAVTGQSGWGLRCDYGDKTFNRSDFEIELDLTDWAAADALVLIYGEWGTYISEGGAKMGMDILKSPLPERPHDYLITLNTGGAGGMSHNESLEGWTNNDEAPWLDSYSGVIVTAEDDILNISFKENGENVDFKINDFTLSMPKSVVFAQLDETFHLGFGTGMNSGVRNFILNHAWDGEDRAYYNEETGAYWTTKKAIEGFVSEVASADLTSTTDFLNLYTKTDEIHIDSLYSYDKNYLNGPFQKAIDDLTNKAFEKFGNKTFIDLYQHYANALGELTGDLTDEKVLGEALEKVNTINTIKAKLATLELTEEDKQQVATIDEKFNADNQKVQTACKTIYSEQVNHVIELMNNATTFDQVKEAEIAYSTISTTYRDYMDPSELEQLEANLATAREAFVTKFGAINSESGFATGEDLRVVDNGSSISAIAWGSSSTADANGSGLMYTKEKLDVAKFSATYNVSNFREYAIGFMAEPEYFSAADDASVQEHKGLVFLLKQKNATTASAEAYLIDGTCNRFFDGRIGVNMQFDIPATGEINLEFNIEQVNNAGIYDNYFTFKFNGQSFNSPMLKSAQLLGAFEDLKGYFFIGSQNASNDNPFEFTLNKINGKDLSNESLAADVNYSPVLSGSEFNYKIDSNKNLVIGINPMLKTLKTVEVDGTKLDSKQYTYTRNSTLTLKSSYLNTLTEGDHEIKVTTDGGSCTAKLKIEKEGTGPVDPEEPEEPTGGCGGSVAIASSTIGALALLATGIVLKKKKQK